MYIKLLNKYTYSQSHYQLNISIIILYYLGRAKVNKKRDKKNFFIKKLCIFAEK